MGSEKKFINMEELKKQLASSATKTSEEQAAIIRELKKEIANNKIDIQNKDKIIKTKNDEINYLQKVCSIRTLCMECEECHIKYTCEAKTSFEKHIKDSPSLQTLYMIGSMFHSYGREDRD